MTDIFICYLKVAKHNYMPTHGGCVNGMLMEEAFLSIEEAKIHLMRSDTMNAVKSLISSAIYDEGKRACDFLADLLISKYSQAEITAAIDEAIANARFSQNPNGKGAVFYIWGNEIQFWAPCGASSECLKEWLLNSPGFQKLRDIKRY